MLSPRSQRKRTWPLHVAGLGAYPRLYRRQCAERLPQRQVTQVGLARDPPRRSYSLFPDTKGLILVNYTIHAHLPLTSAPDLCKAHFREIGVAYHAGLEALAQSQRAHMLAPVRVL